VSSVEVDDRVREAVLRYLQVTGDDPELGHEIFTEDAVLEFPQSGETFVGKRNFLEWRKRYPAAVTLDVRRLLGRGDLWVAEVEVRYDGGEPMYGVSILEFRDGRAVRETIYGGPPWEAPEWRAPWRHPVDRDEHARPAE
jgi:hypothetical protein